MSNLLNGWFDPDKGETVFPPPGQGAGNWCGGHSVFNDKEEGRLLMYYRVRRPRALEEEDRRGSELYVAESRDGLNFQNIWAARKQDFGARSVEKGTLARGPGGGWRLFLSYQPENTRRWQVDLLEADEPGAFDPARRRPILLPDACGADHVKDPVAVSVGGKDYLFANYVTSEVRESTLRTVLDERGNISGMQRGILQPEASGWDRYTCRLTSVLKRESGVYFFYDGNDALENLCEEKAGLAVAQGIEEVPEKLTLAQPLYRGVRYVEAVEDLQEGVRFYYEFTRADGSHELRTSHLREIPAGE